MGKWRVATRRFTVSFETDGWAHRKDFFLLLLESLKYTQSVNFNVRQSTEHDLKNLQPVNSSAKETLRKFYQRIESIQQLEDFPTTLIVAEINGQLVGRCEYRIISNELYFLSLGVLGSYRKQGVLRKMFEFLESIAAREICKKITCETIEETGNREIFEKLGMIVVSKRQSMKYVAPDGSPVCELFMEKTLN